MGSATVCRWTKKARRSDDMAEDEILMTPDNLKSNIFDTAFGNTPHKVYVVYDNLMDELIFKLLQPDTLVAEFPISNYFSLLVEPSTFEVVGMQLSEFTKEHLPKLIELIKIWSKNNLSSVFGTYKEIDYKPKNITTQSLDKSHYFYRPEKIDTMLAGV